MKIKIEIKDFPDNISIRLKEDFLKILFNEIKKKTSQRDLAKRIGVTEITISQWKLNKKGINGRFISLKAIKKIIKICDNIGWGDIEKNIIEYKARTDRKSIKNPRIPIIDSKGLREIVIHIMADGCDRHYAAYYNEDVDKNAKEEFIRELNETFGNVEVKKHEDHINFPMAIPYILSNYFKVDFLSKKCRVPEDFFKTNKNYLIAVLRAMVIDEGTIDGSNIRIDSCNKEFLEDIKKVCDILELKYGKTWQSEGPIYRFNILAESISKVYRKISPLPIKRKEFLLKFACDNQNRNWKYELPGETKKKILKNILKKPLTSVELSNKLLIPRKVINKNTRYLERKNIIKKDGKKVYTFIYKIKDIKLAKKFIKNPEKFLGGNKLSRYGKTQLEVLKLLNRNKYCRYIDFLKVINIDKAAMYKCLKGMTKKKAIKKQNKKYCLNRYGRQILNLPEEKARYVLYANVKDLSKIDLNGFGI